MSDPLPAPPTILDTIADPVFVTDIRGAWVYANDACCNLLGCSRDSLLGQQDNALLAKSGLDTLKQLQQQAFTTQTGQEQEIALRNGKDEVRILSVKISVQAEQGQSLLMTHVLRDITRRVEAEQRLQQESRRERLLGAIAKHLLQSIRPENLLECSMEELRRFLEADRVLFYSLRPSRTGVIAEAVADDQYSLKGILLDQTCFDASQLDEYRHGHIQIAEDLDNCDLPDEQRVYLKAVNVQSHIAIPVVQETTLLGLICVHDCSHPRPWRQWEVEALRDVATQVGSAIAQADLYTQVRKLNAELETQVEQRTRQLQQALDFEATLKRITDRVRDSLDESQILQTAVEELTGVLGAKGSNTALYDLEQGTSTIYYEYNESLPPYQGRVAQMEAFPEVYHQLLDGQYFQFCSKEPNPVRGHVAMFACPIRDDRGVLGDLWLINEKDYEFEEQEIRLVQQVANQCAIAIRQARLYQAAQAQVKELERLNHLKDDFLSTVSHELRTPVTSMRVALQLLGVTLNQELNLNDELQKPKVSQNRVARYYQVLREECEREISLINDLLDLQRLDGGNHPITPQRINLQSWLVGIVNGFHERAQSREQVLSIHLPDELPQVVSDQASLERIFVELLNNACKYTPPGSAISVTAVVEQEDQVNITVSNSGVEISPAELPRIFDKFYRVPSSDPWKQGGTGLGLALVQKLLWHIGGHIEVVSKSSKTSFMVTLPTDMTLAL
ncbi:GAF domain-containing protein [Oscillatoria sp. CS-180]|uniref:sensor histidine kinase n=1 Tax=Oscillatoria sp. CS-180 TaxID=3021720 RepID=UPI00232FDF62|nr:GAF domain-containing protein [Oscillatoria sp. CS-180]MDB9526741.1 GAF domain-containing protein [Oscillatoria sp. CS-180]